MITTAPLKTLVDPGRPITYGIVQAGEDFPGGIPYIRPIDMNGHSGVDSSSLRTTSPEIARSYRRSSLLPGDVVVSIGPGFGKTMIVPEELAGANLTQGTARVAPRGGVSNRFLSWALQSRTSTSFWESQIAGATFRALNLGPLLRTPVPCPSYGDQQAIADFLDRETAKIDSVIEKQRILVNGLRGRRAALITTAVTGHLNIHAGKSTSAPRSNRALKTLAWVNSTAPHFEALTDDDEVTFMPLEAVWADGKADTSRRTTKGSVATGYTRFDTGDILLPKVTPTFEAGRVFQINLETTSGAGSTELHTLRAKPGVDARYIAYVCRSLPFLTEGASALEGVGNLRRVPASFVGDFPVAVSDPREQSMIADYLDTETVRIDALIAHSERLIELSQERRSALITAAVTGQIDIASKTMTLEGAA